MLFIGCFEKTRLSYGEKYTSQEKKSTTFIFKQILNTVFGVILKIDNRSHGREKQNAIDKQIQSAKEHVV